jgi:hypothetical protein
MGARLTVRRGLPFLFSHAAAAFHSKEKAAAAIVALGGEQYGESVNPRDVACVLENIRSDLRAQGIEFLDPLPEEVYGKFGLPGGQK